MPASICKRFPRLQKIPKEKFPNHVLIIPDGNGRWAQRTQSSTIIGHRQGYGVLKKVLETLQDLPINIVTVWGFAADNWKRPQQEVNDLMKLFERGLKEILPDLQKNNSRFIHLGRKDRIPDSLKKLIDKVERKTKTNNSRILCLAIDFGGEDQELRMMQAVYYLPKGQKITLEVIKKLRDGYGQIPPADLIIRTSGEKRTSDLGWLERNSEFYSIAKLLPDTQTEDFVKAIIDYSKRERRFGARP